MYLLVKKKKRKKKERRSKDRRKTVEGTKVEELIFVVRQEESRIGDMFHGVAWSFEASRRRRRGTGFFYARRAAADGDSRWKFSKQWRVSRDEPGTDIYAGKDALNHDYVKRPTALGRESRIERFDSRAKRRGGRLTSRGIELCTHVCSSAIEESGDDEILFLATHVVYLKFWK